MSYKDRSINVDAFRKWIEMCYPNRNIVLIKDHYIMNVMIPPFMALNQAYILHSVFVHKNKT